MKNSNSVNENIMSYIISELSKCDADTMQHCLRVGENAKKIMKEYKKKYHTRFKYGVDVLGWAGTVHDLGKSKIPLKIIMKPTKLTQEERDKMKCHTVYGEKILSKLNVPEDNIMMQTVMESVKYHHERFDGKGYPLGLKEKEIPLSAQMIGLADCFDALISARAYKPAFPKQKAYDMIVSGECGSFSEKIISCLDVLMK